MGQRLRPPRRSGDGHARHGCHTITTDRWSTEFTRDLGCPGEDVVIANRRRTGDAATAAAIDVLEAATLPTLLDPSDAGRCRWSMAGIAGLR